MGVKDEEMNDWIDKQYTSDQFFNVISVSTNTVMNNTVTTLLCDDGSANDLYDPEVQSDD